MKSSSKKKRPADSQTNQVSFSPAKTALDQKQVSWFKSATSKLPSKTSTLREVFDVIENGKLPLQDKIRKLQDEWLRAKEQHGEKSDEAKAIYKKKQALKEKSWLPAVSLSALFNGKRANENVSEHTGLLQIDIDHLESPTEWNRVCKLLQGSPHIWKIWRSISGDGIKAAMLIPPDTKTHRDAFKAAAAHVHELTGKDIDEACKDPARICFLSRSKVWTNPKAFPIEPLPPVSGNGSTHPVIPITDLDPLKQRARTLAEKWFRQPITTEWKVNSKGRWFLSCPCADSEREHTTENKTWLWLNPESVPQLFCNHILCSDRVAAFNLWFAEELKTEATGTYTVLSAAEILKLPVDEHDCLFGDRLLSKAGKLDIVGQPGLGKTRLVLQFVADSYYGHKWLDIETHARGIRWLILQTENNIRRLQTDIRALKREYGSEWLEHVFIHVVKTDMDGVVGLDKNFEKLKATIQQYAFCGGLIIDPLRDFGIGDLNSDEGMTLTCGALGQLYRIGNPDRAIVPVHHALPGKAGALKATGYERIGFARNNKVLVGWVRAQINIAPVSRDDNEQLVIACGKNNDGKEFPPFGVKLDPHKMIYEVDSTFDLTEWETQVASGKREGKQTINKVAGDIGEFQDWTYSKLVDEIGRKAGCARSTAQKLIKKGEHTKCFKKSRRTSLYSSCF